MKTDLKHVLIPLHKHGVMRIEDARGRALAVFGGEVWLTQEGDPDDYVLGAGEVFELDRRGLAVVHAFQDSTLALLDPRPARSQGVEA